jgi:type II secretion system protein N
VKAKILSFLASDPLTNAWAKIPVWARRALVYPSFFFFWFFVFCYWTFPYARVRDFLIQKAEYEEGPGGRLQPTGWDLAIVELSPSWVTGIELQGVRVRKAPEEEGGRALDLSIPQATARVGLVSTLLGSPALSFDAEVAGGRVAGEVELEDDALRALDLEIEDLRLRRLGGYTRVMGLPLSGTLTGTIDMTFPEDPQQTEGEIHATVTGLKLGDGESRLELPRMRDGLTVDPIGAGDVALEIVTSQGAGEVRRLSARGPHLALDGSGSIHFATPLSLSRVDVLLAAQFTDAYKSSSPRTQALFALLEGNPMVRSARTPEGKLQLRIRGSIGSGLNATPAGRERPPTAAAADAH